MQPLCQTLLLVATLLVIPSLCGEALEDGATVPRVNSCCRVTFNWPTAQHVRCPCDELVLGAGDIPAGATSVLLSGIANLTISENAFYHLSTLRRLHLRDIGHVTVESGGLRLPRNNAFDICRVAQTDGCSASEISAMTVFTGQWRDDMDAVKFSVKMENVGLLKLSRNALDTRIKKISLKNVHMPECQQGTFDFKTAQVELVNVTIPEVRSRCFCFGEGGIRPARGITLRSSTLGTVHREAIWGNIMDIQIESTMIRNITEQGIMAHVGSFYMGESNIGTLSAKGLSVSFKKTFKMKEVRINYMKKDALIIVQRNPDGDQATKVLLERLEVGYAENGSFAIHRLLPIDIQMVDVQEAAALPCPTYRRVLALTGLDGREELTSSERNVFHALYQDAKSLCDENDDLGEHEKPDEELTSTPEVSEDTGFFLLKIVVVAFWILMVVVGLAVVVGIAGIVFICFLCWHMQRSNKPTRETNEGKPLTGAAARGRRTATRS